MTRRRNHSPTQRQHLEADRQRNLDQLHHRLSERVKQLHHGQAWRDWLTVASKFHRYSWHNSLLILFRNQAAPSGADSKLRHLVDGHLGLILGTRGGPQHSDYLSCRSCKKAR
jgi:hypothetical protein